MVGPLASASVSGILGLCYQRYIFDLYDRGQGLLLASRDRVQRFFGYYKHATLSSSYLMLNVSDAVVKRLCALEQK